jgi:hypothetical protein
MVVALDLERNREPVSEIEHAGVLPRPLQHPRALARQPPQEERGVLVAAVLRPEQREDLELEVVGLPLEERDDAGELPVREAEPAVERLFRDEAQVGQSSRGPGCGRPLCRSGPGAVASVVP